MRSVGPSLFWSGYAAWFLLECWVLRRDRRQVIGKSADRATLPLLLIAIIASLVGAFWAAHRVAGAAFQDGRVEAYWTGIALMWGGLALRLWAVLTLGRFFRTKVFLQEGHKLISTGPYRLLRHPGYVGSILTLVGLGLALENWLSLAVSALIPAIAFGWRIRTEETALAAAFGGAWDEYRRRTWVLIPGVW